MSDEQGTANSTQGLARQAVRGTLLAAAGNVAVRAVGLAGALYLMARVPPRDFGVVEYAASLLAIWGSLGDWGFSLGAIHRQERVDETFSTCLVLRLALAAGVLAVLGAGAAVLEGTGALRTRLDVLAALGGAVVVDAAGDVWAARLRKALRFGRLTVVDVVAVVVATAVGVALAAGGLGRWALVGNRASHSLVRAVGLRAATLEPTRLRFVAADARWLLRYGLPLWLGGLATAWVLKFDDLVVGQMEGELTLGHYGRAYALALVPLGLVSAVLTRVSFPLYARLQADRARLSEAFRLATGATLRLTAPLALGMALAIGDLLAVLGWEQWTPMVPLFRWLLVYAALRPLMDDAGSLLAAVGQTRVAGHTLLGEAAALLVLCPLLTWQLGAEGAAVSVGLVVVGGLAVWYIRYLPRHLAVAYRSILLWPLVSVGLGTAAGAGVAAWARLGVGLAGGVVKLLTLSVVYAVALLALDGRQTVADLRTLRRHAFGSADSGG